MCQGEENKSPLNVRSSRAKFLSKDVPVNVRNADNLRQVEGEIEKIKNNTSINKPKTSRIL